MGQALSEQIRFSRRQRGLSLRDLALKAGTTKGHVWDLEKDMSRNPTLGCCVGFRMLWAFQSTSLWARPTNLIASASFAAGFEIFPRKT